MAGTGRGRRPPVDLDAAVAFRIHRTQRLLRTHLSRFLDAHEPGLSPEQWFVLARLADRAPVRQVALAEPALGDPPNVSRLVDALVERGYVRRSPDPGDRRSWRLDLTSEGNRRLDALAGIVAAEREAVFAGITEDELATFRHVLDRVDENLRRLLLSEG